MMPSSTTVWRFFALSLATHALALLLMYPLRAGAIRSQPETIPVSLLPPSETKEPAPGRIARTPPTRMTRAPSVIAKRDSRLAPEKPNSSRTRMPARPEPPPVTSDNTAETPRPSEPHEKLPEETVVAERQLPSLKELLPSATWSSSSARADT